MASSMVSLCEAIVAALNDPAAGLNLPVPAVLAYLPQYSLSDLDTMRVTVSPSTADIEGVSRSGNEYSLSVDVGVQKHLASGDNAEIATLMELGERIEGVLRLKRLGGYQAAVWSKSANSPVYAVEHLQSDKVFTSVWTFTFRIIR